MRAHHIEIAGLALEICNSSSLVDAGDAHPHLKRMVKPAKVQARHERAAQTLGDSVSRCGGGGS